MSTGVTVSGFDDLTKMFQRAAEALEDEPTMRDICHAALRPVADAMYDRVQKRSGKTADDIRIGDEPGEAGMIRTAVGFGSRGRMAQFLEYGTPFMAAYPFIRPSYDEAGGAEGMSQRVAAGVRELLEAVLR